MQMHVLFFVTSIVLFRILTSRLSQNVFYMSWSQYAGHPYAVLLSCASADEQQSVSADWMRKKSLVIVLPVGSSLN